jgi:MFS family permease
MKSSEAGVVISLFFLAIMAPGLMLNRVIAIFGRMVNLWSLVAMSVGLLLMSLPHPTAITLTMGAILTGLGYGVMQPIIYDKAATNAPPHLATLALAIVMAINYLAILLAPFIIEALGELFGDSTPTFAFLTNALMTLVLAFAAVLLAPRSRVLGSDD